MHTKLIYLPKIICLIAIVGLLAYGPIPQFAQYHEFADQSHWMGIPHVGDVFSNVAFAVVGLWGFWQLRPYVLARHSHSMRPEFYGYGLFVLALLATAVGSSFYHLAPNDDRLVWDRLPIALTCAGLLAGFRAQTHAPLHAKRDALLLILAAILSTLWWYMTNLYAVNDLRPYLLLQSLPLVLIPLWQWIYGADKEDRQSFAWAVLLYVMAKISELNDHLLLQMLEWVSGHTLKHLFAALAMWVLMRNIVNQARRHMRQAASEDDTLMPLA